MKTKFAVLLVMAVLISAVSCKRNAAQEVDDFEAAKAKERARLEKAGFPEMTFESSEFDFGTVNEGDIVKGSYHFTNTGKSDLIITAARASCGCTVPEYERGKVIKSGETGTINFKFDTHGKPENQHKNITIYCNTKNEQERLTIKGYVTPKSGIVQ